MKTFLFNFLLAIACGMATFGVAVSSYTFLAANFFQPVTYHRVELLTPQPVIAGSEVVFRIHRTKRKLCAATFDIYFMTLPTDSRVARVLHSDMLPGTFTPVGTGYIDVALRLPASLPSGQVQFIEVAKLLCDTETFTAVTPPAIFTVQ